MARHSRGWQGLPTRRIESVVKAVAVTMVFLVIGGLGLLAYHSQAINSGAPRSAVEYQLRRAQELLDADPSSPDAWLALGAAQSDAGMYAKAIDSLQRVIQADEQSELAWMELGQAYRRRGDQDKAIEAYENALKWAQQALDDRRAELEAKAITQELVLPEAGARACIALAQLYADKGDFDKARASAQRLIDDNPMDASALIALGGVEEAAGDTAAAVEAYRAAQRYLPHDPDIADALKRLGAE